MTLTPAAGLSLSVDAYQIDVDNRITLTGLLSGAGIRNILIANGFSGDQSVRFFTNAVDTRTRGFDVVGILGLGGLTVVLEEGHREEWFESSLIRWLTVVTIIGFACLIYGQVKARKPVLKLQLLFNRQFWASSWLMPCLLAK